MHILIKKELNRYIAMSRCTTISTPKGIFVNHKITITQLQFLSCGVRRNYRDADANIYGICIPVI